MRYSSSLPVPLSATSVTDTAPVAELYLPPGTSLAQVLTIARAYWRKSLLIAFLLSVAIAVGLKLFPKTYTATATLMVNYEVTQGGKEFLIAALGSYMATQVEVMESDRVLLSVIDRLGLTHDRELTAGFDGGNAAALRAWVLKNLRANLTINQGRGSQLLYVEAAAKEPQKAEAIANAVVDVYLFEERRLVNGPASERARDYSLQLTELQGKVKAAQERVTEFRRLSGVSDITAQNGVELQSLNALEQQLLTAQNARRAAEARSVGDQAVSSTVLSSQTIQTLKGQLALQEEQLAQAQATLGARHPKVIELRSQIATTRAALQREIAVYSSSNATEVLSGRGLEQKLQHAVEEQRARLLAVRQEQDEGAKLLLELESAQAVYKRALDGYDEIMFASAGKLTNVSLMSRAMLPITPAKPKKLKLMLLGLAFAALVGLAAPFGYELWCNRRVRCRDDLERDFGMPVLAEFAAVRHEAVNP